MNWFPRFTTATIVGLLVFFWSGTALYRGCMGKPLRGRTQQIEPWQEITVGLLGLAASIKILAAGPWTMPRKPPEDE